MKSYSALVCVFLSFFLFFCKTSQTTNGQNTSDEKKPTSYVSTDFSSLRPKPGLAYENDESKSTGTKIKTEKTSEKEETKAELSFLLAIPKDTLYKILDSMAVFNANIKYANGYRITLYSGSDRDFLNKLKSKVYSVLPNAQLYTIYKQPTFTLTMGDYLERYDAELDREKLKRVVPMTLIVEEKINLLIRK